MERLVARFTITLAEPILVEDRESAIHTFKVTHDTYHVEVTWGQEDVPSHMWKSSSNTPCYGISRLNISVSLPEVEPYPEGVEERSSYIEPRLKAYARVAADVSNRLLKYFKLTLGNPLLQETSTQDWIFSNPEWSDENGTPLPRALLIIKSQLPVGLTHSPAFGIRVFTPAQSYELEKALQADGTYEVYEELLADARAALIQGNLRRAVLEMAIAGEVATKQLFSKKGRRAASNIPVALHTSAKKAFGTSFCQSNPKDWHNIESLFQCRNNVAHGNIQNIEFNTLRDWWDSLDALIAWVRSK